MVQCSSGNAVGLEVLTPSDANKLWLDQKYNPYCTKPSGAPISQSTRAFKYPYFENLRERLDDARVFITIHLYHVDKGYFRFGTIAERLKNRGVFLQVMSKHTNWKQIENLPRLLAGRGFQSGRGARSNRQIS